MIPTGLLQIICALIVPNCNTMAPESQLSNASLEPNFTVILPAYHSFRNCQQHNLRPFFTLYHCLNKLEENELVQNGQSFEANAVVAIQSSINANELFYMCQIIDIKQAEDDTEDAYGHKIGKGQEYLECFYLELKDPMAKKGFYLYKRLKKVKIVFVLPAQVFCPSVNLTDNLKLDVQEHQFLADCLPR